MTSLFSSVEAEDGCNARNKKNCQNSQVQFIHDDCCVTLEFIHTYVLACFPVCIALIE